MQANRRQAKRANQVADCAPSSTLPVSSRIQGRRTCGFPLLLRLPKARQKGR